MSQIFLGLVGPIASGKGILADHLKSLGFDIYSLSDVVRQEAKARGLKIERTTLQDLGDDLRARYGSQVLAERILNLVQDPEKNLVFDSIRNPSEINYFRKCDLLNDIKIIGIDAPPELRMGWYFKRAVIRGEDKPDMAEFIKCTLRDRGLNQSLSGQQVEKCLEMSDIKFYNDGTKQDILNIFDEYLAKEFNFDPEVHRRSKEK